MAFTALLLANTRMQLRNRSSLFWHFAFPLLFMVLFGLIFGRGQGTLNVGLVTGGSVWEAPFQAALANVEGVKLTTGETGKLKEELKDGRLHVVVAFDLPAAGQPVEVELFYDPGEMLAGGTALTMVKGILDGIARTAQDVPPLFSFRETGVAAQGLTYMSFLLPGVIGMSVMFSSLFGTAYPLVMEREKGILRQIKLTPVKTAVFLGAKSVGMTIIAFMQAAIIIVTGVLLFEVQIKGSLPAAALVVLQGSLMMVALGLVVSGTARRMESVDSIANVIAMPMMFLAGTFFPIDAAPGWLQSAAAVLPLTYFNSALRDVLVRGEILSGVLPRLGAMALWTLAFIVLAAYLFRWEAAKNQNGKAKRATQA
jgi:ABC-2 type transport system permease protein